MKRFIIIVCILVLGCYLLSVFAPKTWDDIAGYVLSNKWVKYTVQKGSEMWQGVNKWFYDEKAKFKQREEDNLRGSIYRAGNYVKNFVEEKILNK